MTQPVFIFSAGPRSGSTLLQRLITSSGEVLVWGESNGAINNILNSLRLLEISLRPFNEGGAHGAEHFRNFLLSKNKSNQWVANMNPPIGHVMQTYKNMFENLYGAPAKALNFKRWGIKEVRGTKFTIHMLRLIFPEAKFIFLVRNPMHCLRSIKQRNYSFADNWGRPVTGNKATYFAENWAQLSSAYHAETECFKLRYEDLIEKNFDVQKLCEHVGINHIDLNLIGGEIVDWGASQPKINLTKEEVANLMPLLAESMKLWNYL